MTPEPNTVVKYMMEDVFAQQMPIEEKEPDWSKNSSLSATRKLAI